MAEMAPVIQRPGDPITILFVDDEPAILRVIARVLHDAPFVVVTAERAASALEIIEQRPIDVLVSDIDMPQMSGLELLRIVRGTHPQILRMVLTGSATIERVLHAINEGEVLRFFCKPFDVEVFRTELELMAERIERLRRDAADARRGDREQELQRWLAHRYPQLLLAERNPAGEVLIDIEELTDAVERAGAFDLKKLLGGDA
jgi:DNA-binding NtrC family response regulator